MSRGHLRASHADREQVIETLKAAFVQGRLTKDELDERGERAFAARTYADLAALTADLPAGLAAAPPQPRRPMSGRAKIIWVAIAVAMPIAMSLSNGSTQLFYLLSPFYFMALAFLVAEAAATRQDKRSHRTQLPPGPAAGHGGQSPPRPPSAWPGPGPGQAAGSMMTLRPSRWTAIPNA